MALRPEPCLWSHFPSRWPTTTAPAAETSKPPLVVTCVAGWMNRHQQVVIDYLAMSENSSVLIFERPVAIVPQQFRQLRCFLVACVGG